MLGRYSNKSRTTRELGELLVLVPDGKAPTSPRPPRRRRRSKITDEEIAAAYVRGTTLAELAKRFNLNRRTVSGIVARAGVPLRYRHIGPSEQAMAIAEYESGRSLASIADQLGVATNTVRAALIKMGVEMRDCHARSGTDRM